MPRRSASDGRHMRVQEPVSRDSSFLLRRGLAVAGVGDPGDEDVVRMVDEVVSREGVDELAIAAVVRNGDCDELAVTRGRRELPGSSEKAVCVRREQCGRDEDQW